MKRDELIKQYLSHKKWDIIVIGGGATGLGCAVDAATRGYKVLVLEKYDFASSTSSKSTKLIHGGVRYLKQGNIKLVTEALKERGILQKNAPHLVKNLKLYIPTYHFFEKLYYYFGLYIYDFLANQLSFGKSKWVGNKKTISLFSNLKKEKLNGSISFHDGQFDDARLAINLMQTVYNHNGAALNYCEVTELLKVDDKISGVRLRDSITNSIYELQSKVVINASGVFSDSIINMDNPRIPKSIIPSQGTHIVVDQKFLNGKDGIMIPKTSDGRVLFLLPWHNKCIIGTTDVQVEKISINPLPLEKEVNFILETCNSYLINSPQKEDICSVFVGLRPLISSSKKNSKDLSRSHQVTVSDSGLISVLGGKWTTYRKMSEDAIDKAIEVGKLIYSDCRTTTTPIHGFKYSSNPRDPYFIYGSDAEKIHKLEKNDHSLAEKIHPNLSYTWAELKWCIHNEMVVNAEDLLARRTRCLILDAKATKEIYELVIDWMAKELNKTNEWVEVQKKEMKNLISLHTIF